MKKVLLSLLVLMVLSGVSCRKQTTPILDLTGKEWRLTGWSVSSLDPSKFTITATFTKENISGKSAVNQYNGPYTLSEENGFSVGMVAMTKMAGSEEEMRAEQIYHELLIQAKKYQLTPVSLTLLDKNNNELLIFTAQNE